MTDSAGWLFPQPAVPPSATWQLHIKKEKKKSLLAEGGAKENIVDIRNIKINFILKCVNVCLSSETLYVN